MMMILMRMRDLCMLSLLQVMQLMLWSSSTLDGTSMASGCLEDWRGVV